MLAVTVKECLSLYTRLVGGELRSVKSCVIEMGSPFAIESKDSDRLADYVNVISLTTTVANP